MTDGEKTPTTYIPPTNVSLPTNEQYLDEMKKKHKPIGPESEDEIHPQARSSSAKPPARAGVPSASGGGRKKTRSA